MIGPHTAFGNQSRGGGIFAVGGADLPDGSVKIGKVVTQYNLMKKEIYYVSQGISLDH